MIKIIAILVLSTLCCFHNTVSNASDNSGANSTDSVRIMTEQMFPLQYTDDDGIQNGVVNELVQLITEEAGMLQPHEFHPWPRTYRNVANRENIIAYPMIYTEERSRLFHWIGPLYKISGPKLIRWNSSGLTEPETLKDLADHAVCVSDQTPYYDWMLEQGFEEGVNLFPNWAMEQAFESDQLRTDTIRSVMRRIWRNDRCDFRIALPVIFKEMLMLSGISPTEISISDVPEANLSELVTFHLVTSKTFDQDYLDAIKKAYARLADDGRLLKACLEYSETDKEIACELFEKPVEAQPYQGSLGSSLVERQ